MTRRNDSQVMLKCSVEGFLFFKADEEALELDL